MINSTDFRPPADAESAMRFMLLQLVNPLIDHPEQCSVDVVNRDDSAIFVLSISPDDMEKFIGRNTRTGKSLQIIVGAVGAKSHRRFSLTFRDAAGTGSDSTTLLPEITRT